MNGSIHTPEGVRDIYGKEYAARLEIRKKLRSVFHTFGYQDIRTPSFEFFDIFSKEKGSVLSRDMFKFFDRDGETLVLRPDMTPAVARCAVKYFGEETDPLRLSYIGNNFINRNSLQGRLKEFTQAGAELIGDGSSQADAEILALVIGCLLQTGLKEFQIEVGHMGFLQGLLEEAHFSETEEEEIIRLLENKNFFGIEEKIDHADAPAQIKELLSHLSEYFGSIEKLAKAKDFVNNKKSLEAISRMEEVYQLLSYYGVEKYVSFDLGMTGAYRYYNGILFKGYTYGSGEPIVAGGRYDHLMEQFGKKAEAVGFGIMVDSVMLALTRQEITIDIPWNEILLCYERDCEKEAIAKACEWRKAGRLVTLSPLKDSYSEENASLIEQKAKKDGFRTLSFLLAEDGYREVNL